MPMFFARRKDDGVAGLHILSRLALPLDANSAVHDEQPLGTGMAVPVGPPAVSETDAVSAHRHSPVVFGEPLNGPGADKRGGIDGNDWD